MVKGQMGKPRTEWTFTYYDFARVVNKSVNAIQQSKRHPGGFDPTDLESIIFWAVRNMEPEKKAKVIMHASSIYTDVADPTPKRKRAQ